LLTCLTGKRVLVRVDHNVPLNKDGSISDDTRIVASLKTIKELLGRNAKVTLMTHIGDPYKLKKGQMGKLTSTKIVAERLQELLRKELGFESTEVVHTQQIVGDNVVKLRDQLNSNQILYLENVRFNPAETGKGAEFDPASGLYKQVKLSKDEVKAHAQEMAKLGDIFVMDGFGSAHRAHASVSGVAEHVQGPKVQGTLMQEEVTQLAKLLDNPKRPFVALIGGAKLEDKIEVTKSLTEQLTKGDSIIITGGMSHTFTLAKAEREGLINITDESLSTEQKEEIAKSFIGSSIKELDKVAVAKEILERAEEKGIKLILPKDAVAVDMPVFDFEVMKNAKTRTVSSDKIPAGWQGLDVGPETLKEYAETLKGAHTILWNGPAGVFEEQKFAKGTEAIANMVARATKDNDAVSILGGGDTITALGKIENLSNTDFTHVSTGGGASLEMIAERGNLPGVRAMDIKEAV